MEDLIDARERCTPALHQVHHPSQRDHGPHQHAHIGVEHDEAAERNASRQHLPAAIPQHRQEGQPDQRFEQRLEDARDSHQPDILRNITAVQFLETAYFSAFLYESPDHADAGQIFLHAAADIGKHGLDALEPRMNGAPEENYRQADQGRRQHGQQCQAPIHRDHDNDGQQKRQAGLGPVHDARAEHHAHGVQIVGGARHNVSGAHARVIVRRQLHQMAEQVVAQVVFDIARNAYDDHAHPVLE